MKKGFTLIEMLVAIGIIGILATIAMVNVTSARERARLVRATAFEAGTNRFLHNDLAGEWLFEYKIGNDVPDSSPNGNDGKLRNTGLVIADCISGNCLDLSHGNDDIQLTPNPGTVFERNQFVMSAWLYSTANNGLRIFFDYGPVIVRLNNNAIESILTDDSSNTHLFAAGTISENQWYHISVLYDGADVAHFIDGEQVAFQRHSIQLNQTPETDGVIGGKGPPGPGQGGVDGKLDTARIYTRSWDVE